MKKQRGFITLKAILSLIKSYNKLSKRFKTVRLFNKISGDMDGVIKRSLPLERTSRTRLIACFESIALRTVQLQAKMKATDF
uniref:Uncharacterized protein n=1 Tax=Tolypothrix bouteillei VB521301 TaxID=1479485 RepID=A0A0C1NFK6_9CYAN